MLPNLGRLLVDRNLLTVDQLDRAVAHQHKTDCPLTQAVVELGLAKADDVLRIIGERIGLPTTRINAYTIDPAALPALPERLARKHQALPLFRVGTTLTVATARPADLKGLDELRFASGCEIQPVVALEAEVAAAIDRYYRDGAPVQLPDAEGVVALEEPRGISYQREEEADQSAVRLVDQILARAAADRASDIHLEPQERALRLRLRVDGILTEVANLPIALGPSIVARVKVMAGMDIAEHRLPQDGRFTATIGSRRLDLRASVYPTVWGEKAVLRLLDRESLRVSIDDIGMSGDMLAAYRDLVRRPEGLVLITGPTGSGKTSTLYATLLDLRETGGNIVTLENPVEYELEGINQGQTHDRAGFTFATGLRSILRQDPDIILVGEIRDKETVDIALEASLTGHLVLSTLHTNSAVSTVTRLVEMGLEPYLLTSSVLGILAQRLVRRICDRCRATVPVPPEVAALLPPGTTTLTRGTGCRECRNTGYRGRLGVFEMLRMNDEIRRLVLRQASEEEIEAANRRQGFGVLREAGLARVVEGATTLDEILRVTQVRE